jgi:acyl-CoA thioesterase FadM
LSTQTLKGLLEVERGRYLSLLMTGNEDYYAMMKEKSIAFISHSSQFTYKQPLSPGELYTIETYFPTKNIENKNLKLPFYQEIRNAQGEIIATSRNTMLQIFLQTGKLQQTFIKNL